MAAARAVSLGQLRCSPACVLLGSAGAGKQSEDFADGPFAARGIWEWQVRLDLVVVAAAVLHLGDISGLGEVGHNAVGASFGNANAGGNLAQPHSWVVRQAQQHAPVVAQETPATHDSRVP